MTKEQMKAYEMVEYFANCSKCKSAWMRGVRQYALEIADEWLNNEGVKVPLNITQIVEFAKNGAASISEASWGGNYLIYDGDIAKRLCTPSELKRTNNGNNKPNALEQWLDVQTRAVYQACYFLTEVIKNIKGNKFYWNIAGYDSKGYAKFNSAPYITEKEARLASGGGYEELIYANIEFAADGSILGPDIETATTVLRYSN